MNLIYWIPTIIGWVVIACFVLVAVWAVLYELYHSITDNRQEPDEQLCSGGWPGTDPWCQVKCKFYGRCTHERKE